MTNPKSSFKKIAITAALAGDSKKAHPVMIFDLAGKSPLADYAVLLGVESAPQLEAIEDEVQIKLKQEGIYCLHKDGMRSKNWKVLDYGGTLVHIYDGKAAEFYAIDKVYSGCKLVDWQEPAAAPAPVKAAPAKKAPAKKVPAKKAAVKKTAVKKAAPKKAAPRKTVKKTAVRKAKPARKPAKKAAKKK